MVYAASLTFYGSTLLPLVTCHVRATDVICPLEVYLFNFSYNQLKFRGKHKARESTCTEGLLMLVTAVGTAEIENTGFFPKILYLK